MATFPTLSSTSSVRYVDASYVWRQAEIRFDDGVKQVRALDDDRHVNRFRVAFMVNQADFDTIQTFLNARKYGFEAFDFVHPHLGTVSVRYAGNDGSDPSTFEWEYALRGSHGNWYGFEIEFEGAEF